MEGKMKVAVMNGIGKMGFTERDIPTPKDDEVLVKLDYVGICGSDLHYYESGAIGDYVVEPPFVLGHEPGGVVVEVGKDVKHLKVGDKVALEPGKTCGHCEFCKQGKYNLCPDVVFFATPPVDGVFQEYVAHEADLCFKLPENVSTLEGALIEPLAVGFHAAIQGDAHLGQKAVVMGAGCIGLVSMMALKARGVSEVYVVDIMEKRLEKALELGATGVLNGEKEDVIAKAQELTGGAYPTIRIMPNTPVSVGSGMILYTASANVTAEDKPAFLQNMAAAGVLDELHEELIDAGCAISGCGPAFVDLFLEALADGGVECGLPRDKALLYAAQMVLGSARLALESDTHPAVLKDRVCSPGGSTIVGVHALEDGAFRATVMGAVSAAYAKTMELGKK